MRLGGRTLLIASPYLIRNSLVKDIVIVAVEVKKPAALITIVPY